MLAVDGTICKIIVPCSSASSSLSSCDPSFQVHEYVVMGDIRALQVGDWSGDGASSTPSTMSRAISIPMFETFFDSDVPRPRNVIVYWRFFESAFHQNDLQLRDKQKQQQQQ